MLLRTHQVLSSLQGHLHFFVHFFFTFMGQFFLGHPILYYLFLSLRVSLFFTLIIPFFLCLHLKMRASIELDTASRRWANRNAMEISY